MSILNIPAERMTVNVEVGERRIVLTMSVSVQSEETESVTVRGDVHVPGRGNVSPETGEEDLEAETVNVEERVPVKEGQRHPKKETKEREGVTDPVPEIARGDPDPERGSTVEIGIESVGNVCLAKRVKKLLRLSRSLKMITQSMAALTTTTSL